MAKGKKQKGNTGSKQKMPDHCCCTITCAFCCCCKHYQNECYHKQPMSAKPKTQIPQGNNGRGGKSKGKGKGKSKGNCKGQSTGEGGRGVPPTKSEKPGVNPNSTPGGTRTGRSNPEPRRSPTGTLAQRVQELRQGPRPKLSKSKGRNVLLRIVVTLQLPRSENDCGWFVNSAKYRVFTLRCQLSSGNRALREMQTRCSGYVSTLGDKST